MRRAILGAGVLLVLFTWPSAAKTRATHPTHHDADLALATSFFQVGGLQFNIPAKWISQPPETPARAGQWRIPPSRDQPGEEGRVVCFYFGPERGGTVKENINAWIATMFDAEGHAAAAEVKRREVSGLKISQVVVFGTYSQLMSLPGLPPVSKSNYGLIGAVVEGSQGNIYWRCTGPESLITASLPLIAKVMDSVKTAQK